MLQLNKDTDLERPLCPKCRYTMVHLRGFTGISSVDNKDLVPDRYGPASNFNLFAAIFRAFKMAYRRRWARRRCREVLPEYPFSLICPVCRIIVKRGYREVS